MCFLVSQPDPFNVGTWNSHPNAERSPSFDRNEKYSLDRKLNTCESVNFAKSAVLNDVPPDFVRVVTVSAIQKKNSMQRHRYVKANIVQYTASQTKE